MSQHLELRFDFEATRSGDVLEVDAAEAAGQKRNGADYFVDILRAQAKREGVDAGEFFEQRALAFHDGHACLGPDIAKAENRASVGDDGDKVAATRVGVGEVCVFGDFQARARQRRGCRLRRVLREC